MVAKIEISDAMLKSMSSQILLPLEEARVEEIASNTSAWFNNANALAAKMMALDYLELVPASLVHIND